MGALKYPGADATTQWRGSGRPTMDRVDKLLLHTTESATWPSYPSFFPNLTFNPWKPRGQRWRQHCFINQASTTLKSFDSYKTNRMNVCQIEIVAWVDPNKSTSSAFYTKISEDAYADLAEFYAWLNEEWNTPISNTLQWKEYRHTPPSSYGINNGVRLSRSGFSSYKGLCGHMHAPDQDHGDPSLLNVGLIIEKAREIGDDVALSSEDKAWIKKAIREEVVEALKQDGVVVNEGADKATNEHISVSTSLRRTNSGIQQLLPEQDPA